ncbi:MAG: TIGR03960 family B12-binding radical SAM protein [Acidobacteriota bacterium]
MTTLNNPQAIRAALDDILPGVQKPTRYLGLERNLTRKDWDETPVRLALAFPDAYEIGMSHQGTRILYHIANRRPDTLAERCFAPWPDMAEAMRGAGIPLYSLESYRPLGDFDIVGITLQTELNYINIPHLLDLAGIPQWAVDRSDGDPIILGGGPCTANPEPVADFFDALLIGDGEAGLDPILDLIRDAKAEGRPRAEILLSLAALPGVYVPSLYSWTEGASPEDARWDTLSPEAPFPVKRVWVDELDPADLPETTIVPFAEVVQDRIGLEIMRGCTQSCRFCQAGYWYRPVREHDPSTVADRIERQVAETGFEEVGLLSLSSADYSQVEPLVTDLAERLADKRVSVALPSLRADAFSVGLADAVSRVRKSGFTFAPETGSDRLRRVINKTFTNEDMLQAAEAAFSKGWNLIKVYAMIGLPTETDEDLDELVTLAAELVERGRRARGRSVQVKVSVGCFVPKPCTPFQWQPFVDPPELMRRIYRLKDGFRTIRGAKLSWNSPEEAAHEAMLARGSRRLGAVIHRAWELGALFDGWGELARPEAWGEAMADHGIDLNHELRERQLSEPLPWDIIDPGVRKGFLKAEWRRALRERATADCKWGDCVQCGIPGDGEDIKLALPTLGVSEDAPASQAAYSARPLPKVPQARQMKSQSPVHRKVRFTFAKTGASRFLSHRQTMDAIERALRGAAVPVRYTEGFNPHIKVSMGPALSLGHEALAEVFDIDFTAPIRKAHISKINSILPEGLQIQRIDELIAGAPSMGKLLSRARYSIAPSPHRNWPVDTSALDEKLQAGISQWEKASDGSIRLEVNIREDDGPTASLRKIFADLEVPEDEQRRLRVVREALVLRPRKPHGSRAKTS